MIKPTSADVVERSQRLRIQLAKLTAAIDGYDQKVDRRHKGSFNDLQIKVVQTSKVIETNVGPRLKRRNSIKRGNVTPQPSRTRLALRKSIGPGNFLKIPAPNLRDTASSSPNMNLAPRPLSGTFKRIIGVRSRQGSADPSTPKVPVMSSTQALKLHSGLLTPRERTEITDLDTVYFLGRNVDKLETSQAKENHGYDDSEGYYRLVIGDHLAFRYEILDILGKGSFGQVIKAFDHKRQEEVAIKILVNQEEYYSLGALETKILDRIRLEDPDDTSCIVRMKNCFTFRSHICITQELLSQNLWQYLNSQQFARTSSTLLRRFAVQLLTALSFTSRIGVIHGDVKPENVLLKQQDKSSIRLADFGAASMDGDQTYTYVQSRFYRAPEVVLRLPYSTPIDMWSFGCVLAEMFTGKPIFPAEDEAQLLFLHTELLGEPPHKLVNASPVKNLYFSADGSVKVKPNRSGERYESSSLSQKLNCTDAMLLDLLSGCLAWDPQTRFTAEAALRHPWLNCISV